MRSCVSSVGRLRDCLRLCLAGLIASAILAQQPPPREVQTPTDAGQAFLQGVAPTTQALIAFLSRQTPARLDSLEVLQSNWDVNLVPFVLDSLALIHYEEPAYRVLLELLEKETGESIPRDRIAWVKWLWRQDFGMHPDYPAFKAIIYGNVDPRFQRWFYPDMPHSIRLDEIMWGGVKVDGIPPLDDPKVIPAAEADYLKDKHVVFAIFVNGEARAYPKRILAWHEMTNDRVGGKDVTLVYCTLCGSAILYDQQVGDQQFSFGTSGFLYRSNKLMYDHVTFSLWSTLEGIPVTGKLMGSGLQLRRLPIVTTTWGAWRKAHPETTVLSRDTGHKRDYGEGVAYRDYFSNDRLMFPVPFEDRRLKNKREVLALFLGREPLAFDTAFLEKNPLHHNTAGGRAVVILTDESGANRVYDATDVTFSEWDGGGTLTDDKSVIWQVTENALVGPAGEERERLPAHRAFWFGWHAQFPNSRLVK